MEYTCIYQSGKQKKEWTGSIRLLDKNQRFYEVEINGRGTYFHAIVGQHQYGNYICIPNHDVGCELSNYTDVFWNFESLSKHLRKVDAATVTCALPHLMEF